MGTPAPDAIKCLVDRFDQDSKIFLYTDYQEETRGEGSRSQPLMRHARPGLGKHPLT